MTELLLAIALAASTATLAVLIVLRRRRTEQLRTTDLLTGVANGAVLDAHLERAVLRARRRGTPAALLVIGLDGFTHVNQEHGHRRGDELMRRAAARLLQHVRAGDVLARIGGDEFAILLDEPGSVFGASRAAERVVAAFREPLRYGRLETRVTVSVGIGLVDADVNSAADLLRDAELAMRTAKDRGRDRYELLDADTASAVRRRLRIASELPRALANDEFRLVFQPEVVLRTGEVTGVEALVRWQHPTRGLLAPSEFIGVAEDTGHVIALGRWVLREACMRTRRMQARSGRRIFVGVNISSRHLVCGTLVRDVEEALLASGLAPRDLVIEVTESALMERMDLAAETLRSLRELGVGVAIDDFGTGYSSLAYLTHLPVSTLKIDRCFVHDLVADADEPIVRAVLGLAEALGLGVIAEGVETASQQARLADLGCHEAQGFLFSRPLAEDDVVALLDERRSGALVS